jgi:hypothetical protein
MTVQLVTVYCVCKSALDAIYAKNSILRKKDTGSGAIRISTQSPNQKSYFSHRVEGN